MNVHPEHASGDDRDVNRDRLVRLLLTKAEYEAWSAAADSAGMKLSEWIRRRVQGETKIEAPPSPVIKSKRRR